MGTVGARGGHAGCTEGARSCRRSTAMTYQHAASGRDKLLAERLGRRMTGGRREAERADFAKLDADHPQRGRVVVHDHVQLAVGTG